MSLPVAHRAALYALLGFVLLSAGCAASGPAASEEPQGIRVVLGEPAPSLNPYSPTRSSRQIGRAVFSGLFSWDENGNPVPDLAEAVPTVSNEGLSKDRLTATIRLRERRWHDGRAVTASDVVYTWRLIRDGELMDDPADSVPIADMQARDSRTLVVHLTRPAAPQLWRMIPFVLPEHLLAKTADLESDPYWLRPVGSGPFRVLESKPMAYVRLQSVASAKTILDVVYSRTPEQGQNHFDGATAAVWDGAPGPPVGAEAGGAATGATWRVLIFNTSSQHVTGDPRVRRALRLLVPGSVGSTSPVVAGFRAPESTSDTRAAESLLDAAGWVRGADGLRRRGGKALAVNLMTPPLNIADVERADAILGRWNAIGARAELRVNPQQAFDRDPRETPGGDYDAIWAPLTLGRPAGSDWPWLASRIPGPGAPLGLNLARVRDGQLDGIYDSALRAGSPNQAEALIAKAWQRVDALDVMMVCAPEPHWVVTKGVAGAKLIRWPDDTLLGLLGASQIPVKSDQGR